MAFKRYAHAIASKQDIHFDQWMEEIRRQHEGVVPKDYVGRIAKIVFRKCDPNQYLLSHATIVASVDTYAPKNVQTGRKMVNGVQIEVKWPDFRIDPKCHKYINNNSDAWSRPLLLATYRTFIGAPNYCFVPGTLIQMTDGTQKPIEDVSIGDEVISHTGKFRKVVHKFVRDYDGDVKLIYLGHRQKPIICTPNHPFAVLGHRNCVKCGKKLDSKKRPSSYKQRLYRQYCTDCGRKNINDNQIKLRKVRADELEHRNMVYAPVPEISDKLINRNDIRLARLIGYYLADGCLFKDHGVARGLIFSIGIEERDTIQSILDCIRTIIPNGLPSIKIPNHSNKVCNITVWNTKLATLIQNICGEYAYGKRISYEYINSITKDEILALIGAYCSGDADLHEYTQRIRACSVSLDLIQQIQYLGSLVGLHSFYVPHSMEIGNENQIIFADGTPHTVICKHKPWVLHFDVISSKKLIPHLANGKHQTRSVTSGDLKFVDNKKITYINKIETDHYIGKVFNLEVEEDHSYIVDGTVQVFNCEHIQLPELSKGMIIDAIARDLGESCYIDILVATDRKHKLLCSDILSGEMDSLSMGCISLFTVCTKCGNVAVDNSQLCACILYEGKGTKSLDEDGILHPISELVGHVSIPDSNQFIEASWVRAPAFGGAARRNILNPDREVVASQVEEAASIYELRQHIDEIIGIKKAASVRTAQPEPPGEPPGEPPADDEPGPPELGEDAEEPGPPELGPDKPEGEEPPAPPTEPEGPPVGKFDELLEKAQEYLLQSIVKGLEEKLKPTPEDVGSVTVPTAMSDTEGLNRGNDNLIGSSNEFNYRLRTIFKDYPRLIKWAAQAYKIVHGGGRRAIVASQMTPHDLLTFSWIEDTVRSHNYPSNLYKVAMKVGPSKIFPSEASYLAACRICLGRALTVGEKEFFLWKGRIASLSIQF